MFLFWQEGQTTLYRYYVWVPHMYMYIYILLAASFNYSYLGLGFGDLYIISATWQIYTKNISMLTFGIIIIMFLFSLLISHAYAR